VNSWKITGKERRESEARKETERRGGDENMNMLSRQ
jgi:hypothetical protein